MKRFRGEASQILLQGRYEELLADDESIYAFKRTLGDKAVLVLVNFTNETASYDAALVQGASVLIGNFESPRPGSCARQKPSSIVYEEEYYVKSCCQ